MPGTAGSTRKQPILINEDNFDDFLSKVDALVCDCDGVIWLPSREFEHAKDAVDSFQAAGKKVCFVTNNSLSAPLSRFQKLGYSVKAEDVVNPPLAVAKKLKDLGFSKKAFVLGMDHIKDVIRQHGIDVVPIREGPQPLMTEDIGAILREVRDDPEIGAVIVDVDFNASYLDMLKAVCYLQNPECLFYVGCSESKVSLPGAKIMLGPGYFAHMIADASGREAEVLGKPGRAMVDEYLQKFHNFNMERTVFVGDTLLQDMGLGHACGMKKLLVLTGIAKLKDLDTCDPDLIPDYYVNSFGDLYKYFNKK